jgi:sec-independent protein translocase protein TatA
MLHAFIPGVGPQEMVIVAIVGVLLFGKRLPDVGRSIGKGIVEFKKGLRGLEDELDLPTTDRLPRPKPVSTPAPTFRDSLYDADIPKFEPPTSAPRRAADPVEHEAPLRD